MNERWIKIYEKFIEWEWFQIPEMVQLFLYLLIKANVKDKKWRRVDIKRGQLITSYPNISADTGLSTQTIRTCLKRLELTNEIERKSTHHFTIITICKYESYQEAKEPSQQTTNRQLTDNQQTTNRQLTATLECKNIRNNNSNNNNAYAREENFADAEYYEKLENGEQIWWEQLCMKLKIPTVEEARSWLPKFKLDCSIIEKTHIDLKEFKIHLSRWLTIQLGNENENKNKQDGNIQQRFQNRRGSLEVAATCAEDYKTTF